MHGFYFTKKETIIKKITKSFLKLKFNLIILRFWGKFFFKRRRYLTGIQKSYTYIVYDKVKTRDPILKT